MKGKMKKRTKKKMKHQKYKKNKKKSKKNTKNKAKNKKNKSKKKLYHRHRRWNPTMLKKKKIRAKKSNICFHLQQTNPSKKWKKRHQLT